MVAETGNRPDNIGVAPIVSNDSKPSTPEIYIFHRTPDLQAARIAEAERAMMSIGGQFSLREAVTQIRREGDASALGEIGYSRTKMSRPGVRMPEWDYSVVLWTDLHQVTPNGGEADNKRWVSVQEFEQYQRESLTKVDNITGDLLEMRLKVMVDKYKRQRNKYSGTDLTQNIAAAVIPLDEVPAKEQIYQGKASRVVLRPDESILLQQIKHIVINIPGERTYIDRRWVTVEDVTEAPEHMGKQLVMAAADSDVSFYLREGKRII